jgi:hypothetical protein
MTTPPTADDTNAKINEIHDRLDVLAPYPSIGDVTAKGLARYLAKQAQVSWSRGMNGPGHLTPAEVARMVSEFAAAHALLALADSDPARADLVATQIRDAWEDGGGVGEWTWDHLGLDAGKIAALANELAEVSR